MNISGFFFSLCPVEAEEGMSSWVGVWLPAKVNPLQNHIRTPASSVGLSSTRKSLTDWSEPCRGQKDGWGLEHI